MAWRRLPGVRVRATGNWLRRRRISPAALLFVLLASVYMLTWSGRINSNDALLLLNASSSLVRYGDMRADLGAGNTPQTPDQFVAGPGYGELQEIRVEPLQVWLAAPLYWLALHLPGPGLAHTVYLFNVLVSAAAVSLFYAYARMLAYSERAALAASLLLGLATIVWPYSDTFFQAPLTPLLLLLAAFLLERCRHNNWRVPLTVLAALTALALLPLSRQSALLAIPALMVIALPEPDTLRRGRARLILAATAAVVLVPALLFVLPRWEWLLYTLRQVAGALDMDRVITALHSYLLSPGGSLWGTSPVLLLALPGAWALLRNGRQRYALVAALMLGGHALVYAFWQGEHWFGGLSWPPRFLIPVVPFVLLAAMPVFEGLLRAGRPRLLLPGVALLVAYSLWVQLSAVSLPWEVYGAALPPEAGGLGEWGGGLNHLRWLRPVVIPGLWATQPPDFAWLRTRAWYWPLLFGATSLLALWQLRRQLTADTPGPARHGSLPSILTVAAMPALMLPALALLPPDPLYDAPDADLAALLQELAREAGPDDLVLLNDLELERYLVNYAKLERPRLVSLPFHPGESGSPEQPPEIVSDNPEILLHRNAAQQITALANARERIWLLAGNGPWLPWSVRPVERFMAENHYLLRELTGGPRARLLEYDTSPAPDPLLASIPDWSSTLRYGDDILLTGFSLPRGRDYQPGDSLPVTFYWQALAGIAHSWKVAWFVAAAESPPATQGQDGVPVAGFAPTSDWRPGVPVLDNRALRLPDSLPAGAYHILVVLYRAGESAPLIRLPVTNGRALEGNIGVLPVTIRITQGLSATSRSG